MLKIEQIPLDDLVPHPRNPRSHGEGQVPHLVARLREDGWYANVVVANDRKTILKGHGMVAAARAWGEEDSAPCHVKDYAPESSEALKLMVGDNEVGRLAETDDRALTDLLREISLDADADLLGTGFDEQMLANLVHVTRDADEIADLDAAAEWVGMPEFDESAQGGVVKLVVLFDTEEDREKLRQQLGLNISKKNRATWSTWWPPREQQRLSDEVFAEEEAS